MKITDAQQLMQSLNSGQNIRLDSQGQLETIGGVKSFMRAIQDAFSSTKAQARANRIMQTAIRILRNETDVKPKDPLKASAKDSNDHARIPMGAQFRLGLVRAHLQTANLELPEREAAMLAMRAQSEVENEQAFAPATTRNKILDVAEAVRATSTAMVAHHREAMNALEANMSVIVAQQFPGHECTEDQMSFYKELLYAQIPLGALAGKGEGEQLDILHAAFAGVCAEYGLWPEAVAAREEALLHASVPKTSSTPSQTTASVSGTQSDGTHKSETVQSPVSKNVAEPSAEIVAEGKTKPVGVPMAQMGNPHPETALRGVIRNLAPHLSESQVILAAMYCTDWGVTTDTPEEDVLSSLASIEEGGMLRNGGLAPMSEPLPPGAVSLSRTGTIIETLARKFPSMSGKELDKLAADIRELCDDSTPFLTAEELDCAIALLQNPNADLPLAAPANIPTKSIGVLGQTKQVQLGAIAEQAPNMSTCFMMCIANGMMRSEKGCTMLRQNMQNLGCNSSSRKKGGVSQLESKLGGLYAPKHKNWTLGSSGEAPQLAHEMGFAEYDPHGVHRDGASLLLDPKAKNQVAKCRFLLERIRGMLARSEEGFPVIYLGNPQGTSGHYTTVVGTFARNVGTPQEAMGVVVVDSQNGKMREMSLKPSGNYLYFAQASFLRYP